MIIIFTLYETKHIWNIQYSRGDLPIAESLDYNNDTPGIYVSLTQSLNRNRYWQAAAPWDQSVSVDVAGNMFVLRVFDWQFTKLSFKRWFEDIGVRSKHQLYS